MEDNAKTDTKADHMNIAVALASAQLEMEGAKKDSTNAHFRSSYADLSSVMNACMTALNSNGIAVVQPTGEDDRGRFVETILIHGQSGETLSCRVPLIVAKNDMQGFGSAVTYARRYGLMSMAGIAPEDDDGNAAAANPPSSKNAPKSQPQIKPDFGLIADEMVKAVNDNWPSILQNGKFSSDLSRLKVDAPKEAARVEVLIQQKQEDMKNTANNIDDEIPY